MFLENSVFNNDNITKYSLLYKNSFMNVIIIFLQRLAGVIPVERRQQR